MVKRKRPPDPQCRKITDFFTTQSPTTDHVSVCSPNAETPISPTEVVLMGESNQSTLGLPTNTTPLEQPMTKGSIRQRTSLPPRRSCNKTRLKTYLRTDFPESPVLIDRLFAYIQKPHRLALYTTEFLKFWFLAATDYPILTEEHGEGALYMINKGSAWSPKYESKRAVKAELDPFLQPYRAIRKIDFVNLEYDQQPVNYLAKGIFSNIKTNVQEHYMQMLLRFINLRLGKYVRLKDLNFRDFSTHKQQSIIKV